MRMGEKFSFHKFFIKLSSRKFWVWVVSTLIIWKLLNKTGAEQAYHLAIAIGWVALSMVYMVGKPLEQALSLAVSKMELKFQNSINTNINAAIGGQK